MCVPICYGVIWGCSTIFLLPSDNQMNNSIKIMLFIEFEWKIENVVYSGIFLYRSTEHETFNQIHILNSIAIFIMLLIIISSITIIIICAIKCYMKLNDHMNNLSKRTNHLHFQLFYALVTQTLIPIILMHFPSLLMFFFNIIDKNSSFVSTVANITIAVFPALDPFPVMIIIKNYRMAIFGKLAKPVWSTTRQRTVFEN
ncbi:unnamed protein product [Caenorhabditis angaria]|uniref:G-protein coupled receptors family 1 profile domain-containing protein n=1 Tax=Caenorhabditis angaria TaxID=860376 RepID=A0A9P1IW88_9PELO|nr:unnamed protein product [Caenorhabditis angaria]